MKLMPGTTLLLANVQLKLERWGIVRAEREAGERCASSASLRACTRLCSTYGEDQATKLINALGGHMLDRVQLDPATGQPVFERCDLERILLLAAKLSRGGVLSCQQVQGIVSRRIEVMVKLPILKETADV